MRHTCTTHTCTHNIQIHACTDIPTHTTCNLLSEKASMTDQDAEMK